LAQIKEAAIPERGVNVQKECCETAGSHVLQGDCWRVKHMIAVLRMDLEKLIDIVQLIEQPENHKDAIRKKTA
jgi:hypothetical protein